MARDDFDDDFDDFDDGTGTTGTAVERRVPGTITAARILMYLQAASPFLLIIAAIATNAGDDEDAATTTTTLALGEEAANEGGSLAGLIFLILFLGMIIGLVVFGTRIKNMRTFDRNVALALEAVVLLAAVPSLISLNLFGLVNAPMAIAVAVLLLLPQSRQQFAETVRAQGEGRFDIRNI